MMLAMGVLLVWLQVVAIQAMDHPLNPHEKSLKDAWSMSEALLERSKSGCGQVIDAAMVDGANYTVPLCMSGCVQKKGWDFALDASYLKSHAIWLIHWWGLRVRVRLRLLPCSVCSACTSDQKRHCPSSSGCRLDSFQPEPQQLPISYFISMRT